MTTINIDAASLEEIKALLEQCLARLGPAAALPTTAGDAICSDPAHSDWAHKTGVLPPGAYSTVPGEPLVPVTQTGLAPVLALTFHCIACGALNNPPPHEPHPYYAVTKGLAIGVIRGVSNVLLLTWKISGSLFTRGPGEQAAVDQFNEALALGAVKILPCPA
ncbi:hypothetical protein IW262DRAFT_1456160 [Armillaria fumosa]|nr:hypothetical protein IW262DRAFT_1456160 [Armillaria fumosa]